MRLIRTLSILIVFIGFSPVGDAVNGYAKASSQACWVATVTNGGRIAMVCPRGFVIGSVSGYSAPRIADTACVAEFLRAVQAQFELKWVLYSAATIDVRVLGQSGRRLLLDVRVDGDPVADRMLEFGTVRDQLSPGENPWCA